MIVHRLEKPNLGDRGQTCKIRYEETNGNIEALKCKVNEHEYKLQSID